MLSRALVKPKALRPGEAAEEVEILGVEEINRLLDATPAPWVDLVHVAVATGVRLGELLALQFGDVDVERRQLHVRRSVYKGAFYLPKSVRSVRSIDIGDQLASVLARRRREAGEPGPEVLLFPSGNSKPLDPGNFRKRVWEVALAKAGLKHVVFHSLRHTFASRLIAQGEDLLYVSKQLGHATPAFTLAVYGHLLPGRAKRASVSVLDAELRGHAVDTNEEKPGETRENEQVLTPREVGRAGTQENEEDHRN